MNVRDRKNLPMLGVDQALERILEVVEPLVRELMEGVKPDMKAPLRVDIGVGSTWLEAHS